MKESIAAVVVLYNPDSQVVANVESYLADVQRVYLVDNSDGATTTALLSPLQVRDNVVYIRNGQNLGIAQALNAGAQRAIRDGFTFLLTMDQDSSMPANMVPALQEVYQKKADEPIGIVSPRHAPINKEVTSPFEECNDLFVMTSGNLLNLDAYQKCGPFNEGYFIDHVDNEYCLRLRTKNYKLYYLNRPLNHNLGQFQTRKFMGFPISFTGHSPLRYYYIVRNGLYLKKEYAKRFPGVRKYVYALIVKETVKAIFLEDQTARRLRMLVAAFQDYRKNISGKRIM